MGESPKMFPPSDVHYFFRKIFYLLPKFSDEVPTGDLFFALHPGFSGFQEDFPVTFARKWEKMTLSTLGSKPQNERKLTPKWEKIKSKFSKAGGPPLIRAATVAIVQTVCITLLLEKEIENCCGGLFDH
jgi:hypothetical protein